MNIQPKSTLESLLFLLFFGIFSLVTFNEAQQQQCALKQTCHDCIQTAGCAWCFQPDFKDSRCYSQRLSVPCDPQFRINPRNEFSILLSKALSTVKQSGSHGSASVSSQENLIQVQPQHIQLRLRLRNATRISFFYRQAVDYPVDLYYLMDLSNSMKDDKEKLSFLGSLLVDTMTNITSNFRLGFGSFVDKVVMPYVSTVPHNLEEPCPRCAAPYGYHNVMKLSQNTHRFSGEVNRANVSGNLDAPEGGFDAIMQSIVCREKIGWREKARKLLVFSTDSAFHYAGDGKLGGIVKPNDGCCHLDNEGRYTHSTSLDYPSVSQINLKVIENSINVIFAVTAEQIELYKSLGQYIEGSSCGTLSQDSGNVVQLVVDQYNKITSSIEIKDTASEKYFKVTYYSRCLNPNGPLIQTSKCDGLKVGQTVEFYIDIEAIACPPNPQEWLQKFYIYPVGLSENLTVEVELLCACPCELPGHFGYVEKSEVCTRNGTLKCGICDCYPGYFGQHCECGQDKKLDEVSGCRPPNTTTQLECSGRGSCICNRCKCKLKDEKDIYWGKYCQCNRLGCDHHNGQVCSGPDHGICLCNNTCHCLPGWTGRTCSCSLDMRTCIAPNSTDECSNHGSCVCGECVCKVMKDGTRWSGPYCQRCRTCPGKCNDLRDCIECRVFKSGPLSPEECAKNCTFFELHIVEELKITEGTDQTFCTFQDSKKCKFKYTYEYDASNMIIVYAAKDKECPPHAQVFDVVFSLIGAIVLIGLAILMVWKLMTTIKDRREFAKFEKERMMARWDTGENPIYKQATSTFKNPTFVGKH